jgi:hypothetical protein
MDVQAMAITFVGFYRQVGPTDADIEGVRPTGAFAPNLVNKIREFPSTLPTTCKLIGSWGVSGGQAPAVMVVEAESFADLQFINSYYVGWLQCDWHPTNTGGVDRS